MSGYRLVEPVPVGSRTAPSRAVFGPHETNLGDGRSIGDRHVAYYARRASGGAGVLVTETASVVTGDWPYERAPLAGECGPGWRKVAAACAPYSTLVLAGLGHAGSQGSSAYSQEVMWAPSRVADVVSREPPAELDQDGIDRLVDAFAAAAALAMRSGMHGVEIDAGAFSLLRQFHSGLTNQRADAYGQDRYRFTREVLSAVRGAIGDAGVLALRLSCDEMAPWAGVTPELAGEAVPGLLDGVDLLTVVRGGPYSTGAYRPDSHCPPSFNRDLCAGIRRAAAGSALVVLQGSVVDPDEAEAALAEGVCDLVEMTRAQIADASLVDQMRAGRRARIRPCLLCNQACRVRDNRNPIISCVMDPSAGHETTEAEPNRDRPEVDRGADDAQVLVVGGGPAGLECARVLAAAGRQVTVAEAGPALGGMVTVAGRGSGRDRLRLAVEWLADECRHLGVQIDTGWRVTAAEVAAARNKGIGVVVATGSRAVEGRYGPGEHPFTVDAASALAAGTGGWPDGPVVVHDPVGDAVGVSVAEWLAAEGRPVTLVTPDPVAGTQLSRTGDLADANVRLQRAGVQRQLRSAVVDTDPAGITVSDVWTGATTHLPAAVVVDSGHRLPEESLYVEVGDPALPRAGDCVAPRSILEAVLEGRRAAAGIVGASTDGPRVAAGAGAAVPA